MRRHVIAAGWIFAATGAAAEPVTLWSQAVKSTVSGATIEIDTPLGTKLPVRYSEDGQVSAEAGDLAFYLGSASDTGRWWVAGGRLCHKWSRWFDATEQCIRLRQDGTRIYWVRDDGESGTATIAARSTPDLKPSPPAFALGLSSPKPAAPEQTAPPSPGPTRFAAAAMADLPKLGQMKPAAGAMPPQPEPKRQPASKDSGGVITSPVALPAASPLKPPARPSSVARNSPRDRAPEVAAVPSFKVAGVEDYDVLNVRVGPSSDYAAVGALPPQGRGVKIVGACRLDWCPIRHRGISGWVNSYYLAEDSQGMAASAPRVSRQ